jgi:hypothetical protein
MTRHKLSQGVSFHPTGTRALNEKVHGLLHLIKIRQIRSEPLQLRTSPFPEQLVRATRNNKLALRKRIHKVRAIPEFGIEQIAVASRFSQTQRRTCFNIRGIDQVERRGVVRDIVGEAFDATCGAW